MTAQEAKIAAYLKAMDIGELRAKYLEVFGEESKGGADYLRKKIHVALVRAGDRQAVTSEAERELAAATSESTAEAYADKALEAENDGEWVRATELWAKAASASARCKEAYRNRAQMADSQAQKMAARAVAAASPPKERKPLFGSKRETKIKVTLDGKDITPPAEPAPDLADTLRRSIEAGPKKPKLDPVAPAGETEAQHTQRLTVQETRKVAEAAEARGELLAAADAWGLLAQLDPSGDSALHLKRAHELRALVRTGAGLAAASGSAPSPEATKAEEEEARAAAEAVVEGAHVRQAKTTHTDRRIPPINTLLEREHDGRKVRVLVLANGFLLETPAGNKQFKSLSGVGRAVTGKNTNGFVWFGCTEELPPGRSAADGATLVDAEAADDLDEMIRERARAIAKPETCAAEGPTGARCESPPHGPGIAHQAKTNGSSSWVGVFQEVLDEEQLEVVPTPMKLAIAGKLRQIQHLVGELAELLEHRSFDRQHGAPGVAQGVAPTKAGA